MAELNPKLIIPERIDKITAIKAIFLFKNNKTKQESVRINDTKPIKVPKPIIVMLSTPYQGKKVTTNDTIENTNANLFTFIFYFFKFSLNYIPDAALAIFICI